MSVTGLLAPVIILKTEVTMLCNARRIHMKDYLGTHSAQRATLYLDLS